MPTDHLKFIKDVEAKAIGLSEDRTRRSFDALDQLCAENARLKKELVEAKEENLRLRERLGQNQPTPIAAKIKAPIVETVSPRKEPEDSKDDAEMRFSLLELK